MRLLLLEDDPMLGEGLRDFLRADGHVVDWCTRLGEALALRGEWVQALRRSGNKTPVLVLTARDLLSDRIRGLDSGADDYLVKPFDPEELSARIRAVRRRASGAADPRLQFGAVQVDLAARCAYVHGVRADLTAREWALTEALALRAGRIVAKADLENLVHGLACEVASNALEVHVSSIRRKLGRELIETVRGMGYRWVT